ncbi:MAG: ATP-dependent DNA helicase RecG [Methylococcaceae bacterium]
MTDHDSLARLAGAGSQTLNRLVRLGIFTRHDLLFHLPTRYEDRTRIEAIGHLNPGQQAQVEGRVELAEVVSGKRRVLLCRIRDDSGRLHLRFFHYTARQIEQLAPGVAIRCYGEVKAGYYGLEMAHPDYQLLTALDPDEPDCTLTPVYPATEGLHQKTLRRLVRQVLEGVTTESLPDWLPPDLPGLESTLSLIHAIRVLHQPPANSPADSPLLLAARERLAFEELLAHHLSLSRTRLLMQTHTAPVFPSDAELNTRFQDSLPFALTGAQQRVIAEIQTDVGQARPMMRLVQGDVGCGKTIVAAFAALMALGSGYQVALMAPTDLLAEQHARNFRPWLEPLGVNVLFLSGRIKGSGRRSALKALAEGAAGLAIGTHALFQDAVEFQRLGLVIIDEQHRFGVHQRLALRSKGEAAGLYPHQLIMTATPIPRTLAMLKYADLDLSIIDENPPGRTPVTTRVMPTPRRPDIMARITDWVGLGRQVYWVCPLIEESELLQCEAAEKTAALLGEALPGIRVGLVHGRLKSAEIEAIMEHFKAGDTDLLVATTVIEVGVDVPNASLMIIENAERMGLSQLHQLRGRVGRGQTESHCILLYQPPLSATARLRLGVMRESDDGFVIAEQDLKLRGPGELLGTRQTGQITFRIADLARDAHLMERVHTAAEYLLDTQADTSEKLMNRWIGQDTRFADA